MRSVPDELLTKDATSFAAQSDKTWCGFATQRAITWLMKSGLTIADQGMVSGSSFLVTILLARWLAADQYGAYAIAFSIFILLSLLYLSLLLEPMAVFGGSSYHNLLREYMRALLWMHAILSVGIAILLVGGAASTWFLSPRGGLSGALAGIAIAAPCLFLMWLARRAFYIELSPLPAVWGSFLYSCLVIIGVGILYWARALSPFTAFVLIGTSALVTSFVLIHRLRRTLPLASTVLDTGDIWSRHWKYGRWALLTAVASWIPAYIYYPLLGSFAGMTQSGQLRALMNFASPMEQTQTALAMLFLPYAARVWGRDKNRRAAAALGLRLTLMLVGVAAAYWAVVLTFRIPLFHLLYSGRYLEVAHHLRLVAVGSILWTAAFGSAILLRAMESPQSIFVAYAIAAVISLAVGVPLARFCGVSGGVWGINISDAISFLIVGLILRQKIKMASVA